MKPIAVNPTPETLLSQLSARPGDIMHKVNQLIAINQYFREILPQELKELCYVANFDQGCLVLAAKNPHGLSLLRFYAPDLFKQVRKHCKLAVHRQRCVVIPVQHQKPQKKMPHKMECSPYSLDTITSTARSIKDDKLQSALLRLAASCGGKSTSSKKER
jgi:hypothetical protein